jgi:uncharacterized protein (TIGR02996 family)
MSHAAFRQALAAAPEDVSLRLTFADYLEEQGEDERAKFHRRVAARKIWPDVWRQSPGGGDLIYFEEATGLAGVSLPTIYRWACRRVDLLALLSGKMPPVWFAWYCNPGAHAPLTPASFVTVEVMRAMKPSFVSRQSDWAVKKRLYLGRVSLQRGISGERFPALCRGGLAGGTRAVQAGGNGDMRTRALAGWFGGGRMMAQAVGEALAEEFR